MEAIGKPKGELCTAYPGGRGPEGMMVVGGWYCKRCKYFISIHGDYVSCSTARGTRWFGTVCREVDGASKI